MPPKKEEWSKVVYMQYSSKKVWLKLKHTQLKHLYQARWRYFWAFKMGTMYKTGCYPKAENAAFFVKPLEVKLGVWVFDQKKSSVVVCKGKNTKFLSLSRCSEAKLYEKITKRTNRVKLPWLDLSFVSFFVLLLCLFLVFCVGLFFVVFNCSSSLSLVAYGSVMFWFSCPPVLSVSVFFLTS